MTNLNIVKTKEKGDVANPGNRIAKGDKPIVMEYTLKKLHPRA
ncbi:hypothetical protein [Ulvibacterium sp.]|nr:hypothetical protein [Ulvibacterium sp.]